MDRQPVISRRLPGPGATTRGRGDDRPGAGRSGTAGCAAGFPRRQARARATRRAVLTAAKARFVADGYGGATIQAIADEADVAVQTVYAVFGNKRSILAELVDVSIAGDDAEIAVNARDWMRPVWEAPTAEDRLRAYGAAVRRIMDGAGDVFAVLAAAAAADPDVAELAEAAEQRRRTGAGSVVDSVRWWVPGA